MLLSVVESCSLYGGITFKMKIAVCCSEMSVILRCPLYCKFQFITIYILAPYNSAF